MYIKLCYILDQNELGKNKVLLGSTESHVRLLRPDFLNDFAHILLIWQSNVRLEENIIIPNHHIQKYKKTNIQVTNINNLRDIVQIVYL